MKINETLTTSLLNQALKSLFIAAILIMLAGTQLSQARDSDQSRSDDRRNQSHPSTITIACPEGWVLTWYEQPIYDEEGLFVIGWEKVSMCLPEDLEPVG